MPIKGQLFVLADTILVRPMILSVGLLNEVRPHIGILSIYLPHRVGVVTNTHSHYSSYVSI